MARSALAAAFVLGAGFHAAVAPAQEAPAGRDPPKPGLASPKEAAKAGETDPVVRAEMKDRLRQEVIDQLRAMRMWKLTEELKLDEATAAKLFPMLAKFDDQARDLGRERGELYRSLHAEMKAPAPDPTRLTTIIDRLATNRARRNALEEDKVKAMRKVLTPFQQAKLILVLPRLDDSFRDRIREIIGRDRWQARGGPDGERRRREGER
jgi:hypothetical protein